VSAEALSPAGSLAPARSRGRFGAVLGMTFWRTLKRPLFWVLVILLLWMTWGFSTGTVTISSGDASVGGKKAWITSEFNNAFVLAFMVTLLYAFFVSIAAGMAVIEDDEQRVSEILAASPLSAAEYIWGKFLAVLAAFVGVLGLHLLMMMLFNQVVPSAAAAEIAELRRRNAELEATVEILRSAAAFFAREYDPLPPRSAGSSTSTETGSESYRSVER